MKIPAGAVRFLTLLLWLLTPLFWLWSAGRLLTWLALDAWDALVKLWRPVRFVVAVMTLFGGAALGATLPPAGLGIMGLGMVLLIAALHAQEPLTEPYPYCTFAKEPEVVFVRGQG